MKLVKRLEIVTDSLEVQNVITALEKHDISGYTIIRDVSGKGERGLRDSEGLSDVLKNSMIIVAIDNEQVQGIVDTLRPILKRFGGICLVSDAKWLVH
jgi:nitrogen regulatory protein PII